MDKAIIQTLPTVLRQALMIGGSLFGYGAHLSQDDMSALAGGISAILGVAWSLYASYRKNQTVIAAKGD